MRATRKTKPPICRLLKTILSKTQNSNVSCQSSTEAGIPTDDVADLLAPLTSASELATHPSLSIPYTSKSLLEMAESARELVHREREALWRAKQLLNRFRGDEVWVPLEKMETVQDTLLLDDELINEDYSINDSTMSIEQQAALVDGTQQASLSSTNGAGGNPSIPTAQDGEANGVNTMDMANGDGVGVNATEKVEEQDAPLADAPNGSNEDNNLADVEDQGAEQESKEEPTAMQIDGAEGGAVAQPETEEGDDAMDTGSVRKSVEREASPASTVGHRMTTRAKARESNSPAPLDSHSPSPVPSSIPSINPFFNFPATCLPDRDFGLPAQEAEDTRRVLVLYVQKQEQVVREANALLQGLLKADRMRKDVFRWAKAEGHVGELSDGEDWYDMEEWGLTEPLKKGKDEEEMEDEGRGKRKGRRGGGKI